MRLNIIKNNKITASLIAAGLSIFSMGLSAKTLAPNLQSELLNASEQDVFEVIVTFEGNTPVNQQHLELLDNAGISGGVTLNSLPMVGVVATKSQIESIYTDPSVRSVWNNAPLVLENNKSTEITGVDRLRADPSMRNMGMPYSGRGIGVVVNDSGVDGDHSDHKYPHQVVQNVLAQSNLHSFSEILPISYQEDVSNTDIAGGHGTHVAGIIGGNGAMSSGEYQGVAPGAKIIGYGSGAGLFILDTLGGFDYALTNQYTYNIRVISNSFGSTSDTGSDFQPDHPTNVATKMLSDRGVVVVFSAGNSGNGEATITGNFKKAPWVITVAAGDKSGNLADFSSRGVKGKGGTTVVDGEEFSWIDAPTITAPGVDVISTRASLSSLSALSIADDSEVMDPAHVPYYTSMSGTSMAAPHISGVVALMLEANPNLTWREVKHILQETATNMPGREYWEAGAGYVNAYAAVKAVVDSDMRYGVTPKHKRDFNASALTSVQSEFDVDVPFAPVGDNPGIEFEVNDAASMVMVRANVDDNTVGLSLFSPSGKRYGSGIALPVLGQNIAVTAPAEAGMWTLKANGIGGIAGADVDPVNATNGYAAPGNIAATVKLIQTDGYTGIADSEGHPAQGFIEYAVSEQLVDAKANGFKPDQVMNRVEVADFLMLAGIRQSQFGADKRHADVMVKDRSAVNAVTNVGSALRDAAQVQAPVMPGNGDIFGSTATVKQLELAYILVQTLGLEAQALSFTGDVTAVFNGQRIVLNNQNDIPDVQKGYVQLALDLALLAAEFDVTQGVYDLEPVVTASFDTNRGITRADYAVAITRLFDNLN